ncbi:bifunctional DNA primase/polymerase [Streptomyces diastaticus]|nr:bifunctional DNA primase/polymerase [Streptomyces albidoflavus]
MTPLEGALWLVAHGFPVFPCDHPGTDRCSGVGRGHNPATCEERGKHPAVPFTRAYTSDPQQVRQTFARPRNVGVAIGATLGPDDTQLLVVDSDEPGAIEAAAAKLGHQHEPTMRVTTAKGHHDYYWAPRSMKLGNGLGSLRGKFDGDIRAGNAYVIGPGSVHRSGAVYELEEPEAPPVYAPQWLLDALRAPAVPPRPRRPYMGPPTGKTSPLVRLVSYVAEATTNRNNRLYWAACRAFEHARTSGEPDAGIAQALLDAGRHTGLSEAECRSTIRSAYQRTAR